MIINFIRKNNNNYSPLVKGPHWWAQVLQWVFLSQENLQKPEEAAADDPCWGRQRLLCNASYFFSFQASC